jgi:hypothetical protein
MAASSMAEATGAASGARTLRAVNAPGMVAGERQRRTLRPEAGRPGMGRGGRRPRRRGYLQLRSPWHLPLARRLSCVFARILRSFMHTLLSWQLKRPQTGTSEHELKERACHIAYPPSCGSRQEVTRTSFAC